MPADLATLFHDQDPNKLRVSRPQKFVFLCGGVIAADGQAKPKNLRDYLCRVRPMRSAYGIVRAERATQLYRDTTYGDLISFEEDIARIAAVVLVIAESPGSLAELGAFASNETIRKSLRVVIQEKYVLEESFVRYGPVRRIEKDGPSYLGVYPWQLRKSGNLIVKSVKSHYKEIVRFITDHINSVAASTTLDKLDQERERIFYIIYWVIYICGAVSPQVLYNYVRNLAGDISDQDIKNKIYCMELSGWIGKTYYSGKEYFYVLYEEDPFDYSFKRGVANNDSLRRKMDAAVAHKSVEWPPKHVRKLAADSRKSVKT